MNLVCGMTISDFVSWLTKIRRLRKPQRETVLTPEQQEKKKAPDLYHFRKPVCYMYTAEEFQIGERQIQNLWKSKTWGEIWLKINVPSKIERPYFKGNRQKCKYEWFKDDLIRQVNIKGPLILEHALHFASKQVKFAVKAPNSCLESFVKRCNISFRSRCGNKGVKKSSTCTEQTEKITNIMC